MLSAGCLLANGEWEYFVTADRHFYYTGLANARPPNLAARAKRTRSSSDWSIYYIYVL